MHKLHLCTERYALEEIFFGEQEVKLLWDEHTNFQTLG